MLHESCKIIAIAGGSGSGKTTLAKRISKLIGINKCEIISQDNYYFDLSKKFDYDGGAINFDHPEMLEFKLMASHLKKLKQGNSVNIPCYDFSTHSRLKNTKKINPTKIILVDGILILNSRELLELFDLKVFIDIPEEIRFERRMNRDINERNRTKEGIHNQWNMQVLPMHKKFVKNTINLADIIISKEDDFDQLANQIVKKIEKS